MRGTKALDQLVPLLYDELRGVARRLLRGERPGHTLSTTALVNETYLRLLEARRLAPGDRAAFLGVAAVTMRRLLVDAARRRLAEKRGGGAPVEPLDELSMSIAAPEADAELVALDAAMATLRSVSPRAHQVVELRFFAGLSRPRRDRRDPRALHQDGAARLARRPRLAARRDRTQGAQPRPQPISSLAGFVSRPSLRARTETRPRMLELGDELGTP